jgi:energy-coupling factor transport system ATP-binding protein
LKPQGDAPPHDLLELKGVSVSIKKKNVLKNIDAAFRAGSAHAVLGASGSGKSTLLEAICGFRGYTGSIRISGDEVRRIPQRKLGRTVGLVFQNPQDQFVSATVLSEVMIGLKARGDVSDKTAEAERVMREVGLWKYRQLSPYMLSQGEQRRLALSALLVYRCGLLVCDEPTYAQDFKSLVAIMETLRNLVHRQNLTLLFSTHDRKLARDYADHVWRIGEGGLDEIDKSDL